MLELITLPLDDVESIFEARSITRYTVEAEARAVTNVSINGAIFAKLSAPQINPKNV